MANHASSEKRIRQTKKRTERLRHVRTTVRGYMKKLRAAIEDGDTTKATELFATARRSIDMAVQKGVFHWKTGARYVSRLSQHVDGLQK